MKRIAIVDLEVAINAARDACPAQGLERALAGDVNVLAGIYGELIFCGHTAFDADSLDEKRRTILERWMVVEPVAAISSA